MYEILDKQFQAENEKFGVTKQTALEKIRTTITTESERIQGLTTTLKGYINDLDNVFAVYDA